MNQNKTGHIIFRHDLPELSSMLLDMQLSFEKDASRTHPGLRWLTPRVNPSGHPLLLKLACKKPKNGPIVSENGQASDSNNQALVPHTTPILNTTRDHRPVLQASRTKSQDYH